MHSVPFKTSKLNSSAHKKALETHPLVFFSQCHETPFLFFSDLSQFPSHAVVFSLKFITFFLLCEIRI